jgi:hypothetical protein
MAGVTVARWIAPKPEGLGLTADQVRDVARGLRARRDAAGEGPPNSAAYLDGAMADAAAGDDGPPTPRQEPRDFADIVMASLPPMTPAQKAFRAEMDALRDGGAPQVRAAL